jgi:hypothetical protein
LHTSPTALCVRSKLSWPPGARKHRYLLHRSRGALEMAARARSEPQGRSKWLLEPARSRNALEMAARARLGAAGALERAARARSEPQWRSKWLLKPGSVPQGRTKQLLEPASEPQWRSKWPLEPASEPQACKNYARSYCSEKLPLFACSPNHFALLNFASCMDMHGFALVYIYIYLFILFRSDIRRPL